MTTISIPSKGMESPWPPASGPDCLPERARGFLLASVIASYPSEEDAELIQGLVDQEHPAAGAFAELSRLGADLPALQSRYLSLFDTSKSRVSLYETAYGRMRGLAKGQDLADISGFYRAFGFEVHSGQGADMADHLSVELEFSAVMLLKLQLLQDQGNAEGVEIVGDALAKFLREHLGRFAGAVAQITANRDDAFGPALTWVANLVAQECERLGVVPTPLDFFDTDAEGDQMQCGGGVCIPNLPASPA